ncbi:MAG: family 43 glycosylhydrolase [Kiritimatiellia bacterium]
MKMTLGLLAAAQVTLIGANPCVTDRYTPDPAPVVDGDTLWVFTGHDLPGTYFTMPNWQVLSSKDMKTWTNHGVVMDTGVFSWAKQGNDAWASQAITRDGKWYWYVAVGDMAAGGVHGIGVAVADSPLGPWTDPIGKALIPGDWGYIDPSVMIDDDGQAWLFWGNNGCWYAPLKKNMIELDDARVAMIAAERPELKLVKGRWFEVPGLNDESAFGPHKMRDGKPHTNFEEAPWVYKRGDTYYLEYAAGGVPEHWAYSTAKSIHGPWTYRGRIFDCAEKSFTIHGGSITFKGKNYCFYHAGTAPGGGGFQRSACFEEFTYGADGSIPHLKFSAPTTDARDGDILALAYETPVDRGGLSFAVKEGAEDWKLIRHLNDRTMASNLGGWGDKSLMKPFVVTDREGFYHVFHGFVGPRAALCHARNWNAYNIRNWGRENWIEVEEGRIPAHVGKGVAKGAKLVAPVVALRDDGLFDIWVTEAARSKAYKIRTDAHVAHQVEEIPLADYDREYARRVKAIAVDGRTLTGAVVKVTRDMVDMYRSEFGEWRQLAPWGETIDEAKNDEREYGALAVQAQLALKVTPEKPPYAISPMLVGCFFEDINHSADGGLVAEQLQNGDFEFVPGGFGHGPGGETWRVAAGAEVTFRTAEPVHVHNAQYVHCARADKGPLLENVGWDGISLKKGAGYTVSAWVRGRTDFIAVVGDAQSGKVTKWTEVASAAPRTDGWRRIEGRFTAAASVEKAKFALIATGATAFDLDLVSLMPEDTFKGHGLRKDLAKAIAALQPKFLRFPGGCIVHGPDIAHMYRWKDTVGPYEARRGQGNMWGGRQSYRLGFYEYFQFCEDVGMEPVPVISAGVSCPNPQTYMTDAELDAWVRDTLDLVDFAKGDPATSEWARRRADMGHPAPFKMNYLGIGNEDDVNDYFERGFARLQRAVKERDPSIRIIGTAGATFAGRDYEEGWRTAKNLRVELVDEHYYVGCGWYYGNQNYYDAYDRRGPKVYVGEYAAHKRIGKEMVNDMETALACALHLANLERNGDVVAMASYAPLFGKKGFCRWRPDLIYYDATARFLTTDYYVQWLFGNFAGETYVPHELALTGMPDAAHDAGKVKRFRNRFASSIVRHGDETIVKLVNTTAFEIPLTLDLSALGITDGSPVREARFAGERTATDVRPTFTKGTIAPHATRKLPPYSLTVLSIARNRIKENHHVE